MCNKFEPDEYKCPRCHKDELGCECDNDIPSSVVPDEDEDEYWEQLADESRGTCSHNMED